MGSRKDLPRHSRKDLPRHSRKDLPRHSREDLPRHSREGGNPLGITVIHTGVLFLNQPNLTCLGSFFQAHLIRDS